MYDSRNSRLTVVISTSLRADCFLAVLPYPVASPHPEPLIVLSNRIRLLITIRHFYILGPIIKRACFHSPYKTIHFNRGKQILSTHMTFTCAIVRRNSILVDAHHIVRKLPNTRNAPNYYFCNRSMNNLPPRYSRSTQI